MANTRTRKINQNVELNTTYDFVANDGTFSGTVTGNSFVGPLTGDVTGTVSSLSNHDTADLAEGTNLYFTTARARASFSAGTGVNITSGVISIGQSVSTASDVTFGSVTATTFSGALTGDVTGNADTASALEAAVNIALTGSVTGNVDFDGSGNISITTTTNHNHDDRYYTETESDGKYLLNTTDTLDGNLTVTGDLNVTGTIDLSNADLNIGAADIIFDTTSAGATRGLMWNVSGSGILSKIIGGGTDGGKVTLFANINDAITTGNIFEIKDGSLGSLFLGLSHAGILTAGGGTSTQWNTAYTYSQVGHLPLAGGTLTGTLNGLGANFTDPVTIYDDASSENPRLSVGREAAQSLNFGVEDRVALIYHVQDEVSGGHSLEFSINSPDPSKTFYWLGKQADGTSPVVFMTLNSSGITATGYNKTNWDTAYGWGNHAGLYAPSGYGLGGSSILGSGNDANSKTLTGFYYFASASNTPTTYFQAGVLGSYNGDFAQYGIGSNQEMYFRWGADSWKTIIHSGNIGSQSVNYAAGAGNASTLDTLDSTQFLRSDESDTMTGSLTVNGSGVGITATSSQNTGLIVDGGTNSGIISEFKFGTRKAYISTSGNIYASGLFDIDNTNYYVNPASTSVLAGLTVAGPIYQGASNQGVISLLSDIIISETNNYFRLYLPQGYVDNRNGGAATIKVVWGQQHAGITYSHEYKLTFGTNHSSGGNYLIVSDVTRTYKDQNPDSYGGYVMDQTPAVDFYYDASGGYINFNVKGIAPYNTHRVVSVDIVGGGIDTPVLSYYGTTSPGGTALTVKDIPYATNAGYANDTGTLDGIDSTRIIYGDNSTGTSYISGATLDTALKSGFYTTNGGVPNASAVNFVLHTAYYGEGNLAGFDLACNDSTSSSFYLRPATGGGKGAWQTIITSSNIGSQSVNYAASANTSSTTTHYASRTDGTWYNAVWAAGNPSHLYSSDAVQIQSSTGSIRANVFYDNNDTAYYVNPASTSLINELYLNGAINYNGSVAADSGYGLYFGSSRDSAYGIFREPGAWSSPFPDLRIAFHTGIKLGANSGYNGIRFYTDYDMATQVMSVNNGSDGVGAGHVHVNYIMNAGESVRAPIFYDNNNTGYYLNAAGDSRINTIYFNTLRDPNSNWILGYQGTNYFSFGSSAVADTVDFDVTYINQKSVTTLTDTSYYRGSPTYGFRFNSNADTINALIVNNSGDSIAYSSHRAPIFYDSNDTGYYVDPTSTTSLRTVGSWRADSSDWDGEFNGKIQYHASNWYFQGSSWWYFRNSSGNNIFQVNQSGDVTTSGFIRINANNNLYLDNNYGQSVVGVYASIRYQGVWAMGDSYKLPIDGTSTGNLYGLTWSHPNAGGVAGNLNTHGLLVLENGTFLAALSGSIRARDDMRAPIFYDSDDTAFYLNPNGTSELSNITNGTRARWGRSIYNTNRQAYENGQGYWTGTNGWGLAEGNWDAAWKGGFSGWDIWGGGSAHPQGSQYVHAQGIVSGQHYATAAGGEGYGWMMVGADGATANRYWLRGKWGTTTSGWVEMYHTGNMDAPNKSGTSYYQTNTWMQFNGAYGLYWPSQYGAHFRPNDGSSYTQFRLDGSKNGYGGIWDAHSAVNGIMYDSAGNGGIYREATAGRWYFYHHVGNNCTGINTSTTSSAYGLYVEKGIYSTGDITAYSDVRKKTNIATIDSALDKVTRLRGVYYDRIDDLERGRQIGVIAQEVNEVLPEAVTYAEDIDEYGVKYGNIVGVLIEAIKDQQKQIEELKAIVDGLTK